MMKELKKIISSLVIGSFMWTGCEISGEPPELDFFLNKQWRLEKVNVSGQEVQDLDLSIYRLELMNDFSFTEIGIEGAEKLGMWELDNNGTILNMIYDNGSKISYLIVDLQIRSLVLRVIQSEEKIGSLDILYHLEPVKKS